MNADERRKTAQASTSGLWLEIRAIEPGDKAALAAAVDQSSDDAVYRRAEIAVAVLEPWQGRGVGKALLDRLAERAWDEGINQFTGLMLSDNRPMRRLLAHLGMTRVLSSDAGAVELAVELHPVRSSRGATSDFDPR
jgi:GNAT superfamily N-acetyltransferase